MWRTIKAYFVGREYNITSEELTEKAIQRSQNSVNVFTDVLEELQRANEELAVAKDTDLRLIAEMERNVHRSSHQQILNEETANKIKQIIGG